MGRGRRYEEALEGLSRGEALGLELGLGEVKKRATAKFDETIEVAVCLGLDVRHADQQVRGTCVLPHGTGRSVRVAVFARDELAKEAKEAGADVVGAEDLAEKVEGGEVDFDRCVATPDMMPLVGKLGRVLGPRGLMPNPRSGTVTRSVGEAVKAVKGGSIEFRTDSAGTIHTGIGKASFTLEELLGNAEALLDAVRRAKPSGSKGVYMKEVWLSSTMGPGVRAGSSLGGSSVWERGVEWGRRVERG